MNSRVAIVVLLIAIFFVPQHLATAVKIGVDLLRIEPIPQTARAAAWAVENTTFILRDALRALNAWTDNAFLCLLETLIQTLGAMQHATLFFYMAASRLFYGFLCGLGIALEPLRGLLIDVLESLDPEWVSLAMHACPRILFLGFLVATAPQR